MILAWACPPLLRLLAAHGKWVAGPRRAAWSLALILGVLAAQAAGIREEWHEVVCDHSAPEEHQCAVMSWASALVEAAPEMRFHLALDSALVLFLAFAGEGSFCSDRSLPRGRGPPVLR